MQQTFQCNRCGAQNNVGQPYCWNCKAQFQYNCPNCQAPVEGTMVSCPYCHTLLPWPTEQQTVPIKDPIKQTGNQDTTNSREVREAKKKSPWLVGCSIAAGVVVLIVVITAIAGINNRQTSPSANTSSNSNIPGQSSSSGSLAQYGSMNVIDLKKTSGYENLLITNSSNKLITLSFDWKNCDKDGDYINGFKWDLTDKGHSSNYFPPCVLPMSTLAIEIGSDWPTVSNIEVRELTSPFMAYTRSAMQAYFDLYSDIAFVARPIIGNSKTLDEKWGVPADDCYYLVGEIKNSGQKNPDQIWCQVILKDKGNIVGIYQGLQTTSITFPPGEKMKFKMRLGLLPNMPKSYDSFDFVLWSWLLTKAE